MVTLSIVWVDLRLCPTPRRSAAEGLDAHYRVTTVKDLEALPAAIADARPAILCFDYDHPDLGELHALRETKKRFPGLPILMLTESHSEELAVWAFRSGAGDYFVKPVPPFDLHARLDTLSVLTDQIPGIDARLLRAPDCPVPAEFRWRVGGRGRTQCAINHIEAHYYEPVYLDTLARICGMSASHFSRIFKAEHNETFTCYLCRYRISKAMEALRRSSVSATDVAFAVGFSNPSHFTHSFHRYVGMPPSDYQKRMTLAPFAAELSEETEARSMTKFYK